MTAILDWVTTMFSGKTTLANVFQLLTQVSKIVIGLEERLGRIETRLSALELSQGLEKVMDKVSEKQKD